MTASELHELHEESEVHYPSLIKWMRENANVARTELLSFDLNKEKDKYSKEVLVGYVYEKYKQLCFFPDDEIIRAFKNASVGETVLRWFIPIENIEEQFTELKSKGIIVNKLRSIVIIQAHLYTKVQGDLQLTNGMSVKQEKATWTKLTKDLFEINRRRNYSGGDPITYKNEYEIQLNKLIVEFNENLKSIGIGDKKLIEEISKGKTEEHFLRIMLGNHFHFNSHEISPTSVFRASYELMRILLRNRYLPTEVEYHRKKNILTKWEKYQAQTVKNILKY